MKKLMIFLSIFLLVGCSSQEKANNDLNDQSSSGISAQDLADGDTYGISVDRYKNFDELYEAEYGNFYYGEVLRIEDNNSFVDSVYFKVLKSNNETDEVIRVTIEKDSGKLRVGSLVVLHMMHVVDYDYYSLSSEYKSIFEVKGNDVSCPAAFEEDFINRNFDEKEVFFDYIFK